MNIRAGDVIQQIGDQPQPTPEEVAAKLTSSDSTSGGLVALPVRGQSGPQWITLWVGHINAEDLVARPVQPVDRGPTRNAEAARR
jgi:hypothetical protein